MIVPELKCLAMKGILLGCLLSLLSLPALAGSAKVRYYHVDGLGSVVAVTNEAAEVIERREYEPFGLRIGGEVVGGPGYTGHVHDVATGLDYMQQRYYDPGLGVFLSPDPVAAYQSPVSGFARYGYAHHAPYNYVDPDGRWARQILRIFKRLIGGPAPGKGGGRNTGSKSSGERGNDADGEARSGQNQDAGGTRHGGREPQFPDRRLPRTKHGEPAPDPDAAGPHTQLGREQGRKGTYDQAREFDQDGKVVRDIDFTRHGRADHPNPHQHRYNQNATGGTPTRGDPEPLD
jgi:RHS repeat-associated protein